MILEFLRFKQTEILNTKRNMAYNMYVFGYHFHKHVMYSTPNIMLESKYIHENILCKKKLRVCSMEDKFKGDDHDLFFYELVKTAWELCIHRCK